MININSDLRLFNLTLKRDNGTWPAVLCTVYQQNLDANNPRLILSDNDREYATGLKHDRRKKEFLAGRWAAMEAAKIWMGKEYKNDLTIGKGLFGNPFFSTSAFTVPELSIAHSGEIAAAMVFPGGHQLAVDLEYIRSDRAGRLEAIEKNLNPSEKDLSRQCHWGETAGLFLYWTQKEALSKAIRCGLTIPFLLLEIEKTEKKGNTYQSWFKNFPQYKAVSLCLYEEYIFTVVSPQYTEIPELETLF